MKMLGALLAFLSWWSGADSATRTTIKGGAGGQFGGGGGGSGRQISQNTDRGGNTVSRFQQEHAGLPVVPGSTAVSSRRAAGRRKRQAGHPQTRVYGYHVTGLDEDLAGVDVAEVLAGVDEAVEQAKAAWAGADFDTAGAEAEVNPMVYLAEIEGTAVYAYNVTLIVPRRIDVSPRAYIGLDGSVLKQWDEVKTARVGTGSGGNTKIGWWIYGLTPSFDKLDVTVRGGDCVMENDRARTVNCENEEYDCLFREPYTYPCPYNSDETNGGYSPLNDVHYFTGVTHDMFDDWLGVPPRSQRVPALVHYGTAYPQAFYSTVPLTDLPDGVPQIPVMAFGDGTDEDLSFGTYGRVAHELGHAFVHGTSNLLNRDQEGGLGESLADMTEVALSHYVGRETPFPYRIGTEVKRSGQLRCMDDPPRDGKSIDNIGDYQPGMDVHYSSGIYNKVFYLLSQRLPNGIRDAWILMAATNYYAWVAYTDFLTAAETLLHVAADLRQGFWLGIPYPSYTAEVILEALSEVGIGCTQNLTWTCFES